ncbi:MAG: nitroreductase family protein [Acidobacteria bacterium]|nr:nitroreductase family protein [Acidobacteriota bacterium]
METLEAIRARRSIRRFRSDPVPRDVINRVLEAACMAPSPKNTQPWRFLVLEGSKRLELVTVMRHGLRERLATRSSPHDLENTLRAMEEAPVVLLVFMEEAEPSSRNGLGEQDRVADIQSIGACIQNLLLAAVNLGLGTLWICDVLDAGDAMQRFLNRPDQLVAAVALGYAAESPPERPRRPLAQSVNWAG